jgi:hypothetical protein
VDAPIILVGKVESLTVLAKMFVRKHPDAYFPTEVEVSDAVISVAHRIKGELADKKITLKSLLKPVSMAEVVDYQALEVGKTYVFFLMPVREEKNDFFPYLNKEFAIPVRHLPDVAKGQEVTHFLRAIAKANLTKDDDSIAYRWLCFLADIYLPEQDFEIIKSIADDSRTNMRGAALTILCEFHPKYESLYEKALKYIKESTDNQGMGIFHFEISRSLPNIIGKENFTNETLREWLTARAFHLQRIGLEIIIQRQDKSFAKEVTVLLATSRNRDLQYECIRALSALTEKKLTPYSQFMAKPDETVKEWLSTSPDPKTD